MSNPCLPLGEAQNQKHCPYSQASPSTLPPPPAPPSPPPTAPPYCSLHDLGVHLPGLQFTLPQWTLSLESLTSIIFEGAGVAALTLVGQR